MTGPTPTARPPSDPVSPTEPRIVFAGTPGFAAIGLERLIEAGFTPVAVYTQPDRRAGRGRKIAMGPVKQLALDQGLPVHQPTSLKDPAEPTTLSALKPDLMIVIAYGLLLPPAILAVPDLGCINVHASLLPRWRGAAPIQRALAAGDAHTGVDIMRMEAGLDTGPVLAERRTPIRTDDTGGSLHDRLAGLGADLLVETLPRLMRGEIEPRPQEERLATHARKLDKQEAWLDWSHSAAALDRQVRAFDPWPVAQTGLAGNLLRVWSARPVETPSGATPGQVLRADRNGILVACGDGALLLTRLQLPGKRQVSAAELLNARPLRPGDRLDAPPDSG